MSANHLPTSVRATFILVGLNSAFWLVFAVIVALGAIGSEPSASNAKWVMVVLAIGVSVILAGLVILLMRRNRLAFYAGIVCLAVIAVLSITDQFGLPDLFTLSISLFATALMVKDRFWYLRLGDGA